MKRKILSVLFAVVLVFSGCGKGENREPEKPSVETSIDEEIELYYVDAETGEIAKKEVSITGDLSKGILEELKKEQVLSEACEVQKISVDKEQEKIELDMNKQFGDYLRSMGTTGSEQVLECVVKSYLEAYDCEELKITEDGTALDTGHTVLRGYIRYE